MKVTVRNANKLHLIEHVKNNKDITPAWRAVHIFTTVGP